MLFYLIGSVLFGIAASLVAYGRGRNSLGWLVAGLVIGPFALVAALLPPRPRDGRFHRCAHCAEVISVNAHVCRYCGAVAQEGADR
jgi:hypothetical protein